MKIQRTMRNEVSPDDVFAMVCSPEYQALKCADAGALSFDVSVAPTDDGAVITAKRRMPTTGFPKLLRKFVPGGVTSTETVTWGPAAADGSRTAALHVDFHGTPATMSGSIQILPVAATTTTVFVDAEFKAHVPMIGPKIERIAAPIILSVIDAEERTGQAWVAQTR